MKKILILLLLVFTSLAFSQKPYVIAHRGMLHIAPENTISSWKKAIAVKADYFELDVQLSADDSLMIMHDATVNRTTNGSGTLEKMTYAALRKLDAGSSFSSAFAGEKIPTLFEALMLAKNSANNIKVVIEIKTSKTAVPVKVVQMVQKLNLQNRVLIAGFSLAQLKLVKKTDPTIPVMLFQVWISKGDIDNVKAINGEWVGSEGFYSQSVIDYAHSKGVQYNAWTVDSETTMRSLITKGVDAITTNQSQLLKAITDITEPTDVHLISATSNNQNSVNLKWRKATDAQSGITAYNIYRNETAGANTLLATVTDTLYTDNTALKSHSYYYRIKARNAVKLTSINYSNEILVQVPGDTTPSAAEFITSRLDNNTVVIQFDEGLDATSAQKISNYNIDNSISISAAKLSLDKKTVILKTSTMLDAGTYLLTIQNVKDSALNTMNKTTYQFEHKNTQNGAVAVYNLDELPVVASDIMVIDATANANNGKALNGVKLAEGIVGNALSFDGKDDFVQFKNSPSFNISGNKVSVSLWANLTYKPSTLPGIGTFGPLFDSENDAYSIYADKSNNELRFKVTNTSGSTARPGISGASVVPGQWINIVGVYNGASAKIYLNGEKIDEQALTGKIHLGIIPMLGKDGAYLPTSYYRGLIDQVEVFSRDLSEAEILEGYSKIKMAAVEYGTAAPAATTTAIDELKSMTVCNIYPNPAQNSIQIRTTSESISAIVTVCDLAGRVLIKSDMNTMNGIYQLNTSALSNGLYIVKINDMKASYTCKFEILK